VGDCNRDYQVTVNELIVINGIILGGTPYTSCMRADGNGDGQVTVNEYIQAISYAQNGCPTGTQAAQGSWQAAPLGVTITQEIGSASGARGSRVTIPIALSGGGGTIAGTQLDILYPDQVLKSPTCVKASQLTNHTLSTSSVSDPADRAGTARWRTLLVDPKTASTLADGQIFSCTFTVKTTAPTGTFAISGERQHVSDGAGNEPPSAVTSGSVTVF
jgi:hypothetical protein